MPKFLTLVSIGVFTFACSDPEPKRGNYRVINSEDASGTSNEDNQNEPATTSPTSEVVDNAQVPSSGTISLDELAQATVTIAWDAAGDETITAYEIFGGSSQAADFSSVSQIDVASLGINLTAPTVTLNFTDLFSQSMIDEALAGDKRLCLQFSAINATGSSDRSQSGCFDIN